MDAPETGPWSAPTGPLASEPAAAPPPEGDGRPRREGTILRGAKAGFRLVSYLAGPVAGVAALMAAVPTALGLGAGRGFAVHRALPNAVGFYLVCAMWGGILGGMVGMVVRFVPARAGSVPVGDRPIRLRFWRKAEAAVLPGPRRRRRWPWVVAGLAGLVLVTAYGAGVYLGRVVDRRLADALAAAGRDDPNWQAEDLMAHLEPVPDAENSAIVVGEVVSRLPENWPSPPSPPPGPPTPALTELQQACERAAAAAENVRLDPATAEVLHRELGQHEEAVRLGRTVAGYARGRHELVLGRTLMHTRLPETQLARTATRFLAVDAALRAHDGDLDGALDTCRAVIAVARSIGDEPFVVSQLVRTAIGHTGLKSACRVLGQGEPSDAALARLQALALDEMRAPLLLYALRGERASLDEILRRIGSGELPIAALSGEEGQPADGGARAEMGPWLGLWFDNQRALGLGWTNQAVAIARRPVAEQPPAWKAWDDELERVRYSRTGAYLAAIPLVGVAGLKAFASAPARYQAELGATALLLAAERHRRKTGTWPASADAIAPEILGNPPADPFSGRPFVFERRDGRLIVHSVGPNLKDERGAYEPRRWEKGGADDVGATAWDVPLRRQPPPAAETGDGGNR